MNIRLQLLLVVLVLALRPGATARAQAYGAPPAGTNTAKLTCIVCAKGPLSGTVWQHKLGVVCDACHKLPNRCWQCSLPVRDKFVKTADGRFICQREAAQVVLKADEARQIFHTTAREVQGLAPAMLALRSPETTVNLFDVDYWNMRDGKMLPEEMRRGGFAQSRLADKHFVHTVLLLSAQTRDELATVCAHEFGHLWINENRAPDRQIEPDTIEAICELLAFKLAVARGNTNQQARIKQNPYTNGRILSLITVEAQQGLPAVLAWVRSGTNAFLGPPPKSAAVVEVAEGSEPATTAKPAPELRPPPPPPVKLELRSLLRTSKRTIAVINGERFEVGHELSMLVGTRRSRVRLDEVRDNAVVVTVDGERQTLQLGTK